jgi:beta-glucosidase
MQDLLSRMTTQEKVDQLRCVLGWQDEDFHAGALWGTFRADPWTGRTLENGLNPRRAAEKANDLQRRALTETRLGIPPFLAEEAPHGHMAIGTTVFPTGLGLAATFSEELLQHAGAAIAREIRAQGAHIAYGPVLDLARDPRWSRTEETLGEDPVLAGRLGAAIVRGMRGGGEAAAPTVLPTLKHFIAYGTSEGGQNGGASTIGRRSLLQTFLPPFREAIRAGAQSVMTAYNAVDGQPCTSDRWLLTDVLRRDWGFTGFVVSDLYSINVLHNTLHTATTLQEAAMQALEAGVDMDLGGLAFPLLAGSSPAPAQLDSAVAHILRLKFEMGLFDQPYVNPQQAECEVHNADHVTLARDVARASVVLLKNENILPLNKGTRVYVCGPNADNRYAQLGDYTAPQPDAKVITVRRALEQHHCLTSEVQEADVIVAVVGGSSSRYAGAEYKETGAAISGKADSGEGLDRATLDLPEEQQVLLDSMKQTGKPLIVIYIEGRPLLKNWAATHAAALLTAFYPGEQGGAAIADVLFGDYNPAGRLPISQPRHVGQLPVCYNRPLPQPHDYIDSPAAPLYPFGYGLSYTTFAYSDLTINPASGSAASLREEPLTINHEPFTISFTLTNTGNYDGEEVVQLYVRDDVSSVVLPDRQLRRFARIFLRRGESRRITFTLTADDFALIDRDLHEVVEPGTFTLLLGASSDDIRLSHQIEITEAP